MKRTVLRPPGPAIAATTAHPSGTDRSRSQKIAGEDRPAKPDNLITLAVVDQHSVERARGYDPYNASASPLDVKAWKRRQKPG